MKLEKATRPTMYFIGVTTGSSSIMKVFPEWVKELGIDTEIKGIDIAIHEKPEVYREVVDFIKHDPLSLGALVTTHKIDKMCIRDRVSTVTDLYQNHLYLLNSDKISDYDKHAMERILKGTASLADVKNSLFLLTKLMHLYYGKPVILLIDEYDVPVAKANSHGYYEEMLDTMRCV